MRLSIPGRISAAFAALLLVFAAVNAYTAWEVSGLSAQVARIHRTLLPLPPIFTEIKSEIRGLDLVLEPREVALLRRSVHVARRVHPYLDRLEELFRRAGEHLRAAGDVGLAERFGALDDARAAATARLGRFFDRVEAEPVGDGEAERHGGEESGWGPGQRALRRELAELGREVARLELDVQSLTDRAMEVFSHEERAAVWSALLLTGVGLALGVALTAGVALTLRPLRTLREGVERIARGEYDKPVTVKSSTELGALAADINRMAEAVRNRDARLAEQQRDLVHQERLATVGRLAAQITHELRNPLSSIGLNSELLMDELAESGAGEGGGAGSHEQARALLSSIIQEVERLREITEAYLSFARLPRPEPVPVDLNALAAETLDFVRTEMERARVKTRLDPDRAARPAFVDPHQIRAALLNLLRNAREALEAQGGGHVTVRVRTLGQEATLEVVDDGPGFSEEARVHLYEPFFSTKAQGTGLGLSYVQKIASAQRGRMDVEAPAGGGAQVRLHLPLVQETEG